MSTAIRSPWLWWSTLALAWAVSTALLWPSPWRLIFPILGAFASLACVVGWLVLGRYAVLEHAEEELSSGRFAAWEFERKKA